MYIIDVWEILVLSLVTNLLSMTNIDDDIDNK